MKRSFLLLFCLSLLFWSLSTTIAQQASVGQHSRTHFLNPEQECTGTGELIYDDGSFENGYGWNASLVNNGIICMLFTPDEYPWQFNTACIAFTQNVSSTLDFDIVAYANDGPSGAPGTLVGEVTGLNASGIPAWPALAWYEFDISSLPALEDGSLYIGVRWNNVPAYPGTFIGADESTTTPLQPGYCWDDYDGVWNTNQTLWPGYHAQGIRTLGAPAGPPCPVTAPTDPNPADDATNVSIDIGNISWTNTAGTTHNIVWFGPQGNMVQVYDGAPISSYSVGSLNYFTNYQWKVRCENDTCGSSSPVWSFKTEQNPNLLMYEEFNDMSCWTSIGPMGTSNWSINGTGNAGGTAPELMLSWTPSFDGLSQLLSCQLTTAFPNVPHTLQLKHMCDWFADPAPFMGLAITYDGGTTSTTLWEFQPVGGPVGPEVINVDYTPTSANFQFILYLNGNSFNINFWYVDDLIAGEVIPVEFTSFNANVNKTSVALNWSTSTETNNKGFDIQRKSVGDYQSIGFVQGNGTSTEVHNYAFLDKNVTAGEYTYRLKQVDFDGTTSFSSEVKATVDIPAEFSLAQNYPNPFNPATKISYGLKVDSRVTLKIFDILGQEVVTLLNDNLTAGTHNVTFDASRLNSGVYLYRIEARGADGSNFISVKKMILAK